MKLNFSLVKNTVRLRVPKYKNKVMANDSTVGCLSCVIIQQATKLCLCTQSFQLAFSTSGLNGNGHTRITPFLREASAIKDGDQTKEIQDGGETDEAGKVGGVKKKKPSSYRINIFRGLRNRNQRPKTTQTS